MSNNITAGTIARTIVLLLALANQVLAMSGKQVLNIADDDIYQIVSIIFTVSASAVAWWKNNSFSQAAIKADEYKENIKERNN
ncbi:phage holin [Monoglobus pectinilyticus]|jgi:SPP1 family holin|uniref:Phage holin n=1 Tax=Monoglobus pectinilyticus TaxID=1981510 RepID=A0A2K9P5F7_9FIRM|nr:phage holin [Monoglobus pectinilyticus]AUO19948.1 phage holin [Monoglobus pectinilyticus]